MALNRNRLIFIWVVSSSCYTVIVVDDRRGNSLQFMNHISCEGKKPSIVFCENRQRTRTLRNSSTLDKFLRSSRFTYFWGQRERELSDKKNLERRSVMSLKPDLTRVKLAGLIS